LRSASPVVHRVTPIEAAIRRASAPSANVLREYFSPMPGLSLPTS